jgi:tetratricopeptide (TPR) repeat protein
MAREGQLVEARDGIRALADGDRLVDPVSYAHALAALDRAEWEEAAALFRRALKLGDPELEARLERIRQLVDRDALPAAADLLRECLRVRGRYPDLHALLGTIELRQGHWDDAVSSLARAIELHPNYHDARLELALALEGMGLRAQALDQLALVLEHEPDHARALELRERWRSPQVRNES